MTEEPEHGTDTTVDWRLRPRFSAAATRQALRAEQWDDALGLAKTWTLADPDDTEPLWVIARLAPRCGEGLAGLAACARLRERGVHPGVAECEALLAECRVPEALLRTADLLACAEDAPTWSARAEALALAGDRAAADAAYLRAHRLDAGAYPVPLHLVDSEWDAAILEALSRLPSPERSSAAQFTISLDDTPELDDLRQAFSKKRAPAPPGSWGVLLEPDAPHPRVRLYRRNLANGAANTAQVVERIHWTLQGEIQHWQART